VRWIGPISVRGHLAGIDGRILLDEAEPQRSTVRATVDMATLETGISRRDHHLRTADFFDVERYPLASFESDSVDGELRLIATLGLSRRDFGIGKDGLLTRLTLGDRVHLELTIAAKP